MKKVAELNFEVWYRIAKDHEVLRAAFRTRYDAEKYVEQNEIGDRPRYYIEIKGNPYNLPAPGGRIEFLD